MVNPCFCGCSLKTATYVIAVIEMFIAGFSAFIVSILGGIAIRNSVVGEELDDELIHTDYQPDDLLYGSSVEITVAIWSCFLLLCVMRFYFGIVLKRASDEENLTKCKIWMASAVFFILLGVGSIVGLWILEKDKYEAASQVTGMLFSAFGLWVVYEFMKEIQTGKISRTSSVV